MEDNNNKNIQNSSTNNIDSLPKGGNIFQKGKNGVRRIGSGIKQGIGRGISAIWNRLPIKIKIIIIAIVLIIFLIVVVAALLMSMISETTNVASENVDSFMASASDLDKDAKELFEDKSSLISLKISDINKIYNKLVVDNKGGSETQVLMQYEIGDKSVSEAEKEKRIVKVEDKIPLYKHILMTEKYNFNLIKWQKYTHSNSTAGEKVANFVEDKEKGLQYPDDSKFENGSANPSPTKLEKFIDLTLPYLQTWYIPLAMSNASILSGTEEDSSRAPQFSYNIIKEAYSNVVVNWYELKTHTLVTRYHTYDKVNKHDEITGIEVIETEYNNGDKSYTFNSYGQKTTHRDSVTKIDTSTENGLAGGTKNPMKEDFIRQNDEYKSNFYIKEADVFDAKIVNSFNYQVYSESDAANRRNPKSISKSSATYTRAADNSENKYSEGAITVSENGTPYVSGSNANVKIVSSYSTAGVYDPTNSVKQRVVYKYDMTLPGYTDYENGLEHTVTRIWKDELSQSESETSDYTIDDLIIYNQSEDRKEKVSGQDLCGENYSSSSSSGNISEGTSAPAKEIKIGNYTYPVFNQGNYGQTKHGGSTIATAGCGLCSLTTVVGSITGKNVDPVSCGNDTGWTDAKDLNGYANDLKNVYGINTNVIRWKNNSDGGSITEKERITKQAIIEAMKNNNPVIALIKPGGNFYLGTREAHYVTIVGMEGDTLIIANSAGGLENRENIDTVIHNIFVGATTYECGIVVAKRPGGSSSSTSSTSNTSQTSNQSSTLKGTGQASESQSDVNSTGYTGIFTSGTTGRKFKNYKQNGNTFINNYDISSVGCSWSSECGTVSTIICGSGYSNSANFEDITKKLKSTGGATQIDNWLSNYSGLSVKAINNPSQGQIVKLLQEGCVGVVHDPGYSELGHFMAVLDVKKDGSQIYISNPDSSNYIQNGWNPVSVLYTNGHHIDSCSFIANSGNVPDYSDDGSIPNGSDTLCTGTESGKYYTQLKKTDGLNRIDFMNSNPDIFHRYIRSGGEYLKYVGYARSKLNLSYWNLKNTFTKVYEKHDGSLPWAYGKTLGFENIYGSNKNANQTSGGGRFIWPVPEYVEAGAKMWDQITSTFGNRTHPITGQPGTMHNGIDIAHATTANAKIVAAASGTVMKASDSGDGYGNCVIIQHSDNYYTLYGHMATGSLLVKVGDKVNAGQQIGTMGSTGNSTGNHLHFEVTKIEGQFSMSAYYTSTRLDPCDFFNDDCSPIGGGVGDLSQECIDFVWGWEGNDDYLRDVKGVLVDNDTTYIVYTDPAASYHRCVGHGIDFDAGGYDEIFHKAGYSTSIGSRIPKEFADKVSLDTMSSRRKEIIEKTSGLNLKDCQIDALVCRAYQMGSVGWYYGDTWDYCPGETFSSAYKKWWKQSDFSSSVNYNNAFYVNFMKYVTNGGDIGVVKRRESEWELFQTGAYHWQH